MSKQTPYYKHYQQLLDGIKSLYPKHFNGKVPSTLNKLSNDFLTKYPKSFFFKTIEIKSFEKKKVNEELNNCFPGDYFPNENDNFKSEIYEFLNSNINNFDKNETIIKGVNQIIKNLKRDSLIKKYISLIDIIVKNFDDENRVLCELLSSNPFKYNELFSLVCSNLNKTPLPKTDIEFYAIKNYDHNINTFTQYSKVSDEISELRKEFNEKINLQNIEISKQNQKIELQNQKISNLGNEVNKLKEALFLIRIRDVIKAFVNSLFWSLHENKTIDDIAYMNEVLISIAENNDSDGVKMIVNMLENAKKLKDSGDDSGHYVNNIGFDEDILPQEIRQKYDKLKQKSNCGIENCDCIALLLSIREINNANPKITKKKYNLLRDILDIPVKYWEKNKNEVKKFIKFLLNINF